MSTDDKYIYTGTSNLSFFICKLSCHLSTDMNNFRNILLDFLKLFINDENLIAGYKNLIFIVNSELTHKKKKGDDSLMALLFIFFIVNRQFMSEDMSSKIFKNVKRINKAESERKKLPIILYHKIFTSKSTMEDLIKEINLLMEYINLKNESIKVFNAKYTNQDVLYFKGSYIYSKKTIGIDNTIGFVKRITYLQFYKTNFLIFIRELLQ